jgi:type III restriction enzyme
MALHPEFPASPYEELDPRVRWFPAAEELRENYAKLLPPLVANIREEVSDWRAGGYVGASPTSKALLDWWFETDHLVDNADGSQSAFRYYFAQREAVETVIWLYDVRGVRDRHDLMRFDASGAVSANMFDEAWPRFVVKMATGAGKTKVLSLLMAWSYFHKLYEPDSTLSRNFLLIAPNIIVLDRLRTDFDGLRIFFNDPVLPDNGYAGQNWRDDFQIALHIQDDVRIVRPTGNIFLTNIHRVYLGEVIEPSLDDEDLTDYFLSPFGDRPAGKTTDSNIDLGEIVRDIDELAVFNDEAHHIHDNKLAWFKCIQDIHHKLLQKDLQLALQIDVTATPRHNNGAIFVQTVSDYPLVEAIAQNVVKHPVIPDAASRAKLHVNEQTPIITEKYADYLRLGIEEWRKSYAEHEKLGKKAVLFVMVDDTRNCDEVGDYLAKICPELQDGVLVIHTKQNGEIAEAASGKKKEELEKLRKQSNEIDGWKSPYRAIVSVLMLKEGWDVRNVTVIVGLRAYSAQSNILPEQTLGRGLRRMYFGSDARETVSVMGTPAFLEFVESIQSEGVTFERVPMGGGEPRGPDALMIEVDNENPAKDIDALDIALPKLSRRFTREFIDLAELDPSSFRNTKLPLKAFTPEETREIVFKRMLDDEIDHTMDLGGEAAADHRSVVAFFARQLLKEMRLVGGYDQLYPKVRMFLRDHLFDRSVDLDDPVVLRNLSEPSATKIVFDYFRQGINALTLHDKGSSRIEGHIRLRETRPFRAEQRRFVQSTKSVFNKTVGEANADGLELAFAAFLESAKDVAAYGKNYTQVGFRLDYVKANGELSTYTPDFFVRDAAGRVFIVETKGREELDLPQKMARLKLWCEDANAAAGEERYGFVYVDQESFDRHKTTSFAGLVAAFREYQGR